MSHIPSKAMPHAKAHKDSDSDTFAPASKRKRDSNGQSSGSTAALAIGGILAVGAIAAFVLPGLLRDKPEAKKPKRRKNA